MTDPHLVFTRTNTKGMWQNEDGLATSLHASCLNAYEVKTQVKGRGGVS